MASLKIRKLTEKNTDYAENKKIPEPLPKLPARVLWVAASGSGKTLCLGNMLARKEFGYKNIFKENIFLFSPTFELGDPSMHGVDIAEENVFKTFDESVIEDIFEDQRKLVQRWGKEKVPHILVVFDDMITMLPQSKMSTLTRLFFSARHWKISLFLTTQSYKNTAKAIRLNCSHLMIFKTNNKERDLIGEEQILDMDVWRQVYHMGTSDPYSFLYIDNTKQVRERYYIRFEERLVIDEIHVDEEKERNLEEQYKEELDGIAADSEPTGPVGPKNGG
tara:strand:- start:227 stop:1057 length:831 start_codon:yes stop_codon:yes gene_type:complete